MQSAIGGAGKDVLMGSTGSDGAGDHAVISGSYAGNELVVADQVDIVSHGCERV